MDLKELDKILQIVGERDISELEIEEEGLKLRVRRSGGVAAVVATPAPVPSSAPVPPVKPVPATAPIAAPAPVPEVEEGLVVLKSPIVGTFYRSSDPNAAPFASVGDRVKVGQVLCIIEAMKLMNEIESEAAGEILKVHPDSGRPVQYGDPLFTIRPER